MWSVIVALAAGMIIGGCRLLPPAWLARLPRLMTFTLFLLLFVLGAQIGGNDELMAGLPLLGWRAVVIAAFAVAGSLAALLLAIRWFKLAGPGEEG